MTRVRAIKGVRVRARADKGQGHNDNKREEGRGEVASFTFYCNILIRS